MGGTDSEAVLPKLASEACMMESSEAERGQVIGENSSIQPSNGGGGNGGGEKPVIVRVKRKLRQSPLEALWIEINERPVKRPLLDFQKLSIASSSSSPPLEEPKVKRVLVQHIETIGRSEDVIDFVNSYVEGRPEVDADSKFTASSKQKMRTLLSHSIHNRHLSKAKQQHEELAKSARFEQIWKRRTHDTACVHDEALGEVCRVYDVVRVDMEDEISKEDQEALSKFLPLLRECIPTAAKEIESDFSCQASKQGSVDGYVYDLYAVKEEVDEVEVSYPFPLVQLDDDEYYEGPDNSDYETDDSNAENHPYNDYPEEESSESEEKTDSSGSEESEENESEDETESGSDASFRSNNSVSEDQLWDDEMDENLSNDFSDADSEGLL